MRIASAVLAGCAVMWMGDRPVIIEALAYCCAVASVYLGLGYLKRERA